MHITAIERFLHDNPDIEKKKWTTSDVNREIVKNACKDFKSTVGYIKKFVGQGELVDNKQCPYVSTANVFVSHAWKYTFYDIVYKVMRQMRMSTSGLICLLITSMSRKKRTVIGIKSNLKAALSR